MPQDRGISAVVSLMSAYSVAVRKMLLRDQTTGKNIIWADHEYEHFGEGYAASDEITLGRIRYGHSEIVKPRFTKELERQSSRTKSRAEVFTPSWLVNRMNNYLDEVWFGQKEIFNTEAERDWVVNEHPVSMPDNANRNWHQYVTSTRLEITCGEAPFICSRYDTVSGFQIQVPERIGVLDRKLRIISEHTKTRATWVRWAFEAVKATYGYEYQGDNLLIARINVLETVREHLVGRWREGLSERETEELARIISWNFWQMNGLTDAPPTDAESMIEYSLFEQQNREDDEPESMKNDAAWHDVFADFDEQQCDKSDSYEAVQHCMIYDWEHDKPVEFTALKGGKGAMKKFYAVIGNPPYQMESRGENNNDTPIYHYFYDAAFEVADAVELITPARFLFNAGGTPVDWNLKMLNDEHLNVKYYTPTSREVFENTDIRGGGCYCL